MAFKVLPLNLGFPRIGARRELKKATEAYWKGTSGAAELMKAGADIRAANIRLQREAGIPFPPVNDFSFYDQMLDMSCLLGAIPARYGFEGDLVDLDTFFAMARGNDRVPAMEMTKWFDTNYHYIVPELTADQRFRVASSKIFDEFAETGAEGLPVLIGPVTYLGLSKPSGSAFDPVNLLEEILPVYADILSRLRDQGATWVQMDEPCLCLDLSPAQKQAYGTAYAFLTERVPGLEIFLTTYFEGLRDNTDLAFSLPVSCVHVDLVRAPEQFESCLAKAKETGKSLSLGLVDGRNVWKTDLSRALEKVERAFSVLGEDRVCVAGSCSLIHSPVDLDLETALDPQIKSWMAFATQKVSEIVTLCRAVNEGRESIHAELEASDAVVADRRTSTRIHDPAVTARLKAITPAMTRRVSPFSVRQAVQHVALDLPSFPTTSIGSFPQTTEIRKARAAFRKGEITASAYEKAMKDEISAVVAFQEKIGMDVLVHGEPERNDMVEYFGEQLQGFTFTTNGWVQSYGSRYVKPPIIYGDISRPNPMTVAWSAYAQSLTDKPMKGMLTGPVTILCWSFVRDDQPREATCKQIGLAIRDEVSDLEKAGITVIQIDEPAFREGLPLRRADRPAYLVWAVDSFRLSAACVADSTQIHTHMCYCEFNDIIESIAALDADVISIETSRSRMELLEAFVTFKYPNEIGPGVYDIHSPRVPPESDMVALLEKAGKVLAPEQIWVNPDCGLKTRGWSEVESALTHMVSAARIMRGKKAASG